ncbi:MAG TPA: hypothetical protein PLP86_08985 [Armatimonadota bacterium]|nr:hypothetical protein [Armatimonadota bacterium]
MRGLVWLTVATVILAMAVSPVIAAKKEVDIDAEKKLGQQAVAEVDPTLKFITDEKYVNRVKKI